MSRIASTFQKLKAEGRKGFIPFVTAGDPNLKTSLDIVMTLANCGADIIELGVPFSDPMADGPTIQASSQRALANGVSLKNVLELVRGFRESSEVPIVLFSYLNPLIRYGIEKLASAAKDFGVDGILITDAVDQEAEDIGQHFRTNEIDLISLIAPTTTDARLNSILDRASGFAYAISRAGVTGARADASNDAEQLVNRARSLTDLPIAVGFGISTREQVIDVWRFADAAVVGSAIVKQIEISLPNGNTLEEVNRFVSDLLPQFAKDAVET